MEMPFNNLLAVYDSTETLANIAETTAFFKSSSSGDMTFLKTDEANNSTNSATEEIRLACASKNLSIGDFKVEERHGKYYKEAVLAARECKPDLIIIKSAPQKGFHIGNSVLYGSITDSPCPVLTLNNGASIKQIKNIVLPIDSSMETRQKLPLAIQLARYFGAHIHIAAISPLEKGEERIKLENYALQSKKFLEEKGVHTTFQLLFGKNEDKLLIDIAKKSEADLIMIMVEESASPLFTSIADKLIQECPLPIISIQPRDLKVSWAGM